MAAKSFEDLRVYQHAEELADLVWDIVLTWTLLAKDTVGKQIIRSADGIGTNIAEGHGRGSLNETPHWLRRAFCRKLLSDGQIQKLKGIVDNLGPQLNAYLKSIGLPKT